MNCIILGDKYQKRMKSRGCVGLIKIKHKPIIEHQYTTIKNIFPLANIIYVYGFEHKRFSSFISKNQHTYKDIITIYNSNYDTKNNAYSLYLASKYLNDDCLILFGDHIFHKKTFLHFSRASAKSQVFINKKHKNKLGCIVNHNKIENISYDLDNYLTEIYYLNKNHTSMICQNLQNDMNHNCFIFELINKLIDNNQTIYPTFTEYNPLPLVLNNK